MSEISNFNKETQDKNYAFMCGKCFTVFPSVEEIENHPCGPEKDASSSNGSQVLNTGSSAGYITAEVVKLEPPNASGEGGTALIVNDRGKLEYNGMDEIVQEFDLRDIHEDAEYELVDFGDAKRKRKCVGSEYNTNKLVRDPYFKLDHNSYTFKDTLGDWDERSTKLLIMLVEKYPKVHFLLQFYYERRLTHWENIHACMLNAGYNFTVLQLRMRWREVFAKYRWTMNHNDLHDEKKSFEYMKEMNDLFGVWTRKSTAALITYVELTCKDNPTSKNKRLGFMGWERISNLLQSKGFIFTIQQVEARWRMLVTTYKSMIDHNIMPTVEPIKAAFHERLADLITYVPRRRKDYERYKGKKVKLEKFPESGMKYLIQVYKDNSMKFLDNNIKNSEVWDDIQKSLEALGYCYTVTKIKEIFFATLKLFERVLQHNTIPGAIKREGPHYRELSEIFNMYGCWPHVRRRRKTSYEKHHRKCAQKLRESMQTWTTEESCALLELYPLVLEASVGQTASATHQNDLWVQVAHAFQAKGFPKRDTPEIATHIGLLRQGYTQANNFPFVCEMQHMMEVEEALCYSPDVSKYTGDIEILYWCHNAVHLMLSLYLKIQPLLPFSSLSKEVYARISKEMARYGYSYSCVEVQDEFRKLLFQFTMRRYKPEKASEENWAKNKGILPYKDLMTEVMRLREALSVGFTNGIKPIPDDVLEVIFSVARWKCEDLFVGDLTLDEQKDRMKLVVFVIRREIKKLVKRKPPVARKICVQLLSSLFNLTESTEVYSNDLLGLYCALENFDYEKILTEIMKETHNGSFKLPRRVLDMEKNADLVSTKDEWSNEDPLRPLCVLNVNEIKHKTPYFDELSNEDDAIDYSEVETCMPTDSGFEDKGLELDQVKDEIWETNKNKLVLINKNLGTKTTVHPREDSFVTCINIDDLELKHVSDHNDDSNDNDSVLHINVDVDENSGFDDYSNDVLDENQFDIVHSLSFPGEQKPDVKVEPFSTVSDGHAPNENSAEDRRDGQTSSGDKSDGETSSGDRRDVGTSFLSLLHQQIQETREEEEKSLKVLENQQVERREVLNDLIVQINDMVE